MVPASDCVCRPGCITIQLPICNPPRQQTTSRGQPPPVSTEACHNLVEHATCARCSDHHNETPQELLRPSSSVCVSRPFSPTWQHQHAAAHTPHPHTGTSGMPAVHLCRSSGTSGGSPRILPTGTTQQSPRSRDDAARSPDTAWHAPSPPHAHSHHTSVTQCGASLHQLGLLWGTWRSASASQLGSHICSACTMLTNCTR